jgi:hypothetical protein
LLVQINIAMMTGLDFITWRINVAKFERIVIAFTILSTGEVIRRSMVSILIYRSSTVLRRSVEYYSSPTCSIYNTYRVVPDLIRVQLGEIFTYVFN